MMFHHRILATQRCHAGAALDVTIKILIFITLLLIRVIGDDVDCVYV